ncbi:MAG: hypothetical protein QOH25_3988 [Acidobacteriota bacterium]|jgi:hypothetical protein|nr:hypothetical protein [Acidobacteriota bacterium]
MRLSISSSNLFQSIRQRLTGTARYLGAWTLVFVLLISTASIAAGQTSGDAPITDSATILRHAKLIFVRKKTVFIEAPELENELRKRPEFQRWGLMITRNETDADLIIEVGRKIFTRFVYTVIDPRTNIVMMSGKLSSLGGRLSTKIAKRFIADMQRVRQ